MKTDETNQQAAKELAQSLNGLDAAEDFKLVTITIQDANPVSFSEQCENYLKQIPQESIQSYFVQNILMNVNGRGQALIFVANIQFWTDAESHKDWISEIKRANLLIKP